MATIGARVHRFEPEAVAGRGIRPYLRRRGPFTLRHMVQVLIVAAWVAVGAAVGLFEARRGHWRWEGTVTSS